MISESMLLGVGIFTFLMAAIGVVLTVREFRAHVHPQPPLRGADRVGPAAPEAQRAAP